MPIDPSIILQGESPRINPLAVMTGATELRNRLIQGDTAQQEYNARGAIGEAFRQGTRPDGTVDEARVISALQGDPRGAWKAPEVAAQLQQRAAGELANKKAALELAQQRWTLAGNAVLPLLGAPEGALTPKAVYEAAASLTAMEPFQSPEAVNGLKEVMAGLAPDADDATTRAFVRDLYLRTHATNEGIQAALGEMTTRDTGGAIENVRVNPLTGRADVLASTPKTLSAGESAGDVEVYDPVKRQMVKIPRSQFAAQTGALPGGRPASAPQGLPAGPPLGAEAASTIAGTKSAERADILQTAADRVPIQRALLGEMRQKVKDFRPGPGAENWMGVAAEMARLTGRDDKSIASQQQFNKAAELSIQEDFRALGGTGTDTQLASAMKSNPNQALTRLGIEGIIALKAGLNDAVEAKNLAWQKWLESGKGPETYGQFTTKFNQIYDPRVFQAQHMEAREAQKMLKEMSPAERKKYDLAAERAKKWGWVP